MMVSNKCNMNHLKLTFILISLATLNYDQLVASKSSPIYGSNDSNEDALLSSGVRSQFRLPNLFDFSQFKAIFKKSYDSILEEIVRQKLYLGRAFRAFITAVLYKYRISSSFLAINQMSDWTPAESDDGYIKIGAEKSRQKDDGSRLNKSPMVTLDDIKSELSYIKRHKETPGYREIYKELNNNEFQRNLSLVAKSTRDVLLNYLTEVSRHNNSGGIINRNNQEHSLEDLNNFSSGRENWLNEESDELRSLNQDNNGKYLDEIVGASVSKFTNFLRSKKQVRDSKKVISNRLPDEIFIDHRQSNCFFLPRNQGKCGSCYAFTAIALYEYSFCRATGKRVAFSEQYIIDCGNVAGLHGCKCGWFSRVPKFVQSYGLEYRLNYPYRNREGVCPIALGVPLEDVGSMRVKGSGFVAHSLEMVESVLREAPIAVNTFITKNFREYGGGVDDAIGCRDTNYLHAMVLIGTGREDGEEYWLLRNSFSTRWGVGGHYKLNKNSNCVREDIVSTLAVTFDLSDRKAGPENNHKKQRYNSYIPSDYEE